MPQLNEKTLRDKHSRFMNEARRRRYSADGFADIVSTSDENALMDYFKHQSRSYPDTLRADDVAAITGLKSVTIFRYLRAGKIRSLAHRNGYLIPKQYFLEFVTSHHYIYAIGKSKQFYTIRGGFQSWLAAK